MPAYKMKFEIDYIAPRDDSGDVAGEITRIVGSMRGVRVNEDATEIEQVDGPDRKPDESGS